jgi:hypothetical protein
MDTVDLGNFRLRIANLLKSEVAYVKRIYGGGNNQLFRVETSRGHFALKHYIGSSGDDHDRVGREFGGLSLLAGAGEKAVPRPIAADRDARIAAYEWIDGTKVDHFDARDMAASLAFLGRLHDRRHRRSAALIPRAADACIDSNSLITQVTIRLARLSQAAADEPLLAALLADRFQPAWNLVESRMGEHGSLPRLSQTLSPSDFGKHNMLRRPDGRLVYLDFEYFGWDDPVKLVADTIWHPGSNFTTSERDSFVACSKTIFGGDPNYATRLSLRAPGFALRWALIVLSDFIPERWARRLQAGSEADWASVKAAQLKKATGIIDDVLRSLV